MKKTSAFSLVELSVVILIIGILIAGVTQSSRLIREARLSSARSLTNSSSVASMSSLSAWFETTSEKSFATGTSTFIDAEDPNDNEAIGMWKDINPTNSSKFNVSQATLANQPLYKKSSINGLPTLYFDGSNDCLTLENFNFNNFSKGTEITVFIVQKMTGSSSSQTGSFKWEQTSLTNRFIIFATWAGEIRIDSGNYTTSRITYAVPSSFYNNPQIITFRREDANAEAWINGVSVASRTNATSFLNKNSTATLQIGDCGSAFLGNIGEIIVFDRALVAEDIADVEAYLSKKWKIEL